MNEPDREHRDELASLHALGVLTDAERAELAALTSADPSFAADVRALEGAVAALGGTVPQVDPPAALRARVLASITGSVPASAVAPSAPAAPATVTPIRRAAPARTPPVAWLAAAASLIVAAGLGFQLWRTQDRVRELDARLDAAQREVTGLTQTLGRAQQEATFLRTQADVLRREADVLLAPDMVRVDLSGQPTAPGASARAYWSRRKGMVLSAQALPALPANKSYQVWVIADGAPISAGLVRVADLSEGGNSLTHFVTPEDLPAPKIVAVTIEPEGGVPQPTGEKVLVGLTGL